MRKRKLNRQNRRAKEKALATIVGQTKANIIGSSTIVLSTDQDYRKDGQIEEEGIYVSGGCGQNPHVASATATLGLIMFFTCIDQQVRKEVHDKHQEAIAAYMEEHKVTYVEAEIALKDAQYDIPTYDANSAAEKIIADAYANYKADMVPMYGNNLVIKDVPMRTGKIEFEPNENSPTAETGEAIMDQGDDTIEMT